jgi:hypothetical protein
MFVERARKWSGGRTGSGERKEMRLVGQVHDTDREGTKNTFEEREVYANNITGWGTYCRRGTALAG